MGIRENETGNHGLRLDAKQIVLAVDIIAKLEKTIDVVYYLMEHQGVESFVLMLITAEDVEMNEVLEYEKRDTDILFEIDNDESTYVVLCQDTKVDGGYHFAQRIMKNILSKEGKNVYCTELEVRSTRNQVKTVIFKLLETFIKSKVNNESNQIIYKSLN